MSLFVVDVESDGPIPPDYSMVCFGAVLVSDLTKTFYGKTKPISDKFNPEALGVSGISREQHLTFDNPQDVMVEFNNWIRANNSGDRPIFFSDNNGYDWQWINYYFHKYLGSNPFGHSSRRIGDVWSGLRRDMFETRSWKKLRKTRHTHNPVDDAMGNAQALVEMNRQMRNRG